MIKANIKQEIEKLYSNMKEVGFNEMEIGSIRIPRQICDMGDLKEYIDLIPDGAIEQAIHDQEARDTSETISDFRNSGAPY